MTNRAYLQRLFRMLRGVETRLSKELRLVLVRALRLIRRLIAGLPNNRLTRQLEWRLRRWEMLGPLGLYNDTFATALGLRLAELEPDARKLAAERLGITPPALPLRSPTEVLATTSFLTQSLQTLFRRGQERGESPFMGQHRREIERVVEAGFLEDLPSDEIADRVVAEVTRRGVATPVMRVGTVLNRLRSRAEALISTAIWDVTHQNEQQVWQGGEVEVTAWIWDAVLDFRICPICLELDGRVEARREDFPYQPPQHPNCRCRLLPYGTG